MVAQILFKNVSCSITRNLPEKLLENYKKSVTKLTEITWYQNATRFMLSGKAEHLNACVQYYLTKFDI